MEATVIGFNLWVKAVEKAGTTDPDKVGAAIIGLEVPNMTGGIAKMLPNHHLTKPVLIGEIQDDGQFEVVWKTEGAGPRRCLVGLPGGVARTSSADWTPPIYCGNYNTKTKKCSGPELLSRTAEPFAPTPALPPRGGCLQAPRPGGERGCG